MLAAFSKFVDSARSGRPFIPFMTLSDGTVENVEKYDATDVFPVGIRIDIATISRTFGELLVQATATAAVVE